MTDFILPYTTPIDDRHIGRYRLSTKLYEGNPTQCTRPDKTDRMDRMDESGLLRAWGSEVKRAREKEELRLQNLKASNKDSSPGDTMIAFPAIDWSGIQEVISSVPQGLWLILALVVFLLLAISLKSGPNPPKALPKALPPASFKLPAPENVPLSGGGVAITPDLRLMHFTPGLTS